MSIYLLTLPKSTNDLSFDALKIMRRDNIVLYRGSHLTDDMMGHLSRNADFYDMHYLSDKQLMKIMETADEIGKDVLFLSQPSESKYLSLKIRCLKNYKTPYHNMDEQELVAA